jgi:hypothetical protein
MADQARLFPDVPTASEQEADDREHELDRTPRGVVRQALAKLLGTTLVGILGVEKAVTVDGRLVWRWGCDQPLRVLDWCAGAGVWSSELRAWAVEHGVPVHITAVEKRECERVNLDRWCDEVIIGDHLAALRQVLSTPTHTVAGPRHYHLTLGNPPFSRPILDTLPQFLEQTEAAIILHTTETLQRSEAGADMGRTHPPCRELGIPGTVRFRGPGIGGDMRIYSVSAWVCGVKPEHGWPREILPLLPSDQRGWVEPPGGERVVLPCWPTRPGWVEPGGGRA